MPDMETLIQGGISTDRIITTDPLGNVGQGVADLDMNHEPNFSAFSPSRGSAAQVTYGRKASLWRSAGWHIAEKLAGWGLIYELASFPELV